MTNVLSENRRLATEMEARIRSSKQMTVSRSLEHAAILLSCLDLGG